MDLKDLDTLEESDLLDLDMDDDLLEQIAIETMDFIPDDVMEEALKMSMRKVSRQEKLNRLGGSMAAGMAKKRKDPDYKKMIKYKTLWKKFKSKVMRKYANRGKMAARKASMNSK